MRSIILTAAVLGCALVAACDDAAYRNDEPPAVEPTIDAPPMTAEDAGVPAADTVPDTAPPAPATDNSALPTDDRSSEESVQPESETLFY